MKEPYSITLPGVDLTGLRTCFPQIPLDPYLDDGHRCRALSRFALTADGVVRLPRADFFQSGELNHVEGYGGLTRSYPEASDRLDDDPGFAAVAAAWFAQFGRAGGRFSVHLTRTLAGGDPVPEGRHRDGYDHVGIFVVSRVNLRDDAGLSGVWPVEGDRPWVEGVRLDPGTLLTLDDRRVLHDATELVPLDPTRPGHRDVLILTSPDHAHEPTRATTHRAPPASVRL